MNVDELYKLVLWIENEIINKQIFEKYKELYDILQINTNSNQQKKPFESQKDNLIKIIKQVPLYQLTKEQINFFCKMGIFQYIGNNGVKLIEDILFKNVIDISTSANKFKEILDKLKQGIKKSDKLKTELSDCISIKDNEKINDIKMSVTFSGNASIGNIVELKKHINDWHAICRGFAMVNKYSPEDIKINGATNGSIIIYMCAIPVITTCICKTIKGILDVIVSYKEVNKVCEETKKIKTETKKIKAETKKIKTETKKIKTEVEIKTEILENFRILSNHKKDNGIKKICNDLKKELKNINGEEESALKCAVEKLFNFIELGGDVDFIIPYIDEKCGNKNINRDKYNEIQNLIEKIESHKEKIKLLEFKEEENNSE